MPAEQDDDTGRTADALSWSPKVLREGNFHSGSLTLQSHTSRNPSSYPYRCVSTSVYICSFNCSLHVSNVLAVLALKRVQSVLGTQP